MKTLVFIFFVVNTVCLSSCNILINVHTKSNLGLGENVSQSYLINNSHNEKLEPDSAGNVKVVLENKSQLYVVTREKEKYSKSYDVIIADRFNKLKFADLALGISVCGGLFYLLNNDIIEDGSSNLWALGYPAAGALYILFYPKKVYSKEYKLPDMIPFPLRGENQKYMYIDKIAFMVESGKMKVNYYKRWHHYKNAMQDPARPQNTINNSMEFDNTVFSVAMNDFLYKCNFMDSTAEFHAGSYNSCLLDATVKEITYHVVSNQIFSTNIVLEWQIKDYLSKETIKTFSTEKTSDFVPLNNLYLYDSYYNCIEKSLIGLLNYSEFRENIEMEKLIENTTKILIRPELITREPQDLKNALLSYVIIENDSKKGSGVIISKNGYVLSHINNIENQDSVEIKLSDKTKLNAGVVYKHKKSGIVLLKLPEGNYPSAYINIEHNSEIGIELLAVGVPFNMGAGPTITSGILSGFRKNDAVKMIQTDAKINETNIGGPVFNKSDKSLIGIMCTQVGGFGVEGLSFATELKDIFKIMNIEIK